MKILMIAQYTTFPFEGGNSRFTYLLDLFDYSKNKIEFITSNFYHAKKIKRNIDKNTINELKYKLTLIDEPGYKKNVSIKRMFSHKVLSKRIKKYLNQMADKPDVIYCALPSLDVAYEAIKFAKKNKIRFIIDVQDLWPEAFKMALNIPIMSELIFYPMKKKADYVYSNASDIVAVSETYVQRALSVNTNIKEGLSVYLGTDLNKFDSFIKTKGKGVSQHSETIKIVYIGTLGTSYDIKSIIDAIQQLYNKGIKNIKFVLIGDGPLKDSFEMYAKNSGIDYEFTGRVDYGKMVKLLCKCDIAVNPIIKSSVASIINKVGDYAAAGLPVINTQNSNEYKNLIDKYKAGFNCTNGDIDDIASKIEILVKDKKLREKLGFGNRIMANELFDREKNYNKIIRRIMGSDK